MSDREKIVCLAMDAFRLCIGIRPRNFTVSEIARFVRARAALAKEEGK